MTKKFFLLSQVFMKLDKIICTKCYVPLKLNSSCVQGLNAKSDQLHFRKHAMWHLSSGILLTLALLMFQRPPHGFLPSMRLEAVDRRNPRLIRVATVIDVDEQRLKVGTCQKCPAVVAPISWLRWRRKLPLILFLVPVPGYRDFQLAGT